jgi:FkbM family methyltransferase
MSQLRSLLLKAPVLYEWVQARRDHRFHALGVRNGSFAQHGEDLEIMRLLDRLGARGPYLDIGCNHPFRLNNTYLLYRNGWRGLCLDPLPRFEPLYTRWRPQDKFRRAAISEQAGQLELFEFEADVLSTLDPELARSYQAMGHKLKGRVPVQAMRVDQAIRESRVEGPLAFLSIDIEGHELSALRSMDLDLWKPALVCIEALCADGSRNVAALDHLLAHGYAVHKDLGLNVLLTPTNA